MFRALEELGVTLGRICLSLIFVISGVGKLFTWSDTAAYMQSHGMVAVPVFLVLAVIFELGGGLSVMLGVWARLGALALMVFLIPATLIFHNFWAYEGTEAQQLLIHFLKNVAIFGGLLLVFAHGAGWLSLDTIRLRRQRKQKGQQ